ncbi:hypothetical protein LSAT2_000380 [Lamellibrachia satsuma]|nr:hypothetical protein LSAT2_000380 [Lamellibrachia satsuma]
MRAQPHVRLHPHASNTAHVRLDTSTRECGTNPDHHFLCAQSFIREWSIKYEVSEDWEAEINYEIVLRELLKLVPVAE